MKKALAAIAATIGFCGLAALLIFFAETNYNSPRTNLAADISVNNPVDATTVASDSTDIVDTSTDAGIVLGTSTDTLSTIDTSSDTSSDSSTIATTTPPEDQTSTDQSSTDQIPPPPVAAASPDNPSSTSTIATATITVTPSVPPPPPLPPPQIVETSSPVSTPSAPPISYNETDFRGDQNWQTTWGTMDTTWNGEMDLSAGTQSTGGAVYLKSSVSWANYTMNATLDWTGGQMFGLVANYQNPSNYVLCDYEKTSPGTVTMQLLQYVNGTKFSLSPTTAISWDGVASGIDVSIRVSAVYGTCSWNSQTVSNAAVGPGRSAMNSGGSGAVGFTVNDPTPGTSGIIVSQVSVASG